MTLCFSIKLGMTSLEMVSSAPLKCLKLNFPFLSSLSSIAFRSRNKTPWIWAAPEYHDESQYWHSEHYQFMIPTSHLEFSSETMVFDLHFTHLVMNHCFDKCLNSELKISCGKQNVSSDVLMNARVLLKKILNWFSVNPALLVAGIVDVSHIMVTQECSEVLRVPEVFTFSQYCILLHCYCTFCLHMTE